MPNTRREFLWQSAVAAGAVASWPWAAQASPIAPDLSGGLDPSREFVFGARPDDPEMRESVNIWLWDDTPANGAAFGMPRIGVEAVANRWDRHDVQCNIALGDGRLLTIFESGEKHDPIGADGRARVLGAGPLAFELIEPFRHWRLRLRGDANVTKVDDAIAGRKPATPAPRVPVELEVDLRSAVPPWENGTLRPEAARVMAEQEEGHLIGSPRFEQLFRAKGRFRVGNDDHVLDGGGLRIRRQGVRRLARFWGHAWQSTVFPSGRAFGCLVYPPREDGKPTYNEGFVYEGKGALIPARVVEAPWLRRVKRSGQDVPVVLETATERVRIEGTTLLSALHEIPVTGDYAFPVLQQSIVRYAWRGESANGMLERSSLPHLVERG